MLGPESLAAQREGLSFLSDGMEESGWYELRVQRGRVGDFVLARTLLASVGGRWRYFSVLPRARQGSLKTDVVPQANLLWLDVDSREALGHLGVFEELGLAPSAVVDSGGGFWLYWKLDRLVGTDQVEEWSRRLNLWARGRVPGVDQGCWNRNRCARLVGTVHEDTGVVAQFVPEVSSWARFDPAFVEQALAGIELPRVEIEPVRRSVSAVAHRAEVTSVFNRFRWYLIDPPTEEEVHERGQTRHGIEFALAQALVHDAGCSDGDVAALFDEWQVLKHEETKRTAPGNPYGYLDRTLARVHAETEPTDRPSVGRKRQWTEVDRGLVLRLVAEAEEQSEPFSVSAACAAILEEYPEASYRTAENALTQLAKSGYVDKQKNPAARGKVVLLTAKGREFLSQEGFRRGFHLLEPISGSGSEGSTRRRLLTRRAKARETGISTPIERDETNDSMSEISSPIEGDEISSGELERPKEGEFSSCVSRPELFGFAGSRYQRHAGFEAENDELETILRRNWIDDDYRISFLGRQATRTIQFLTDWDDCLKLLFYEQLFITFDEYPSVRPGLMGTQPLFRSFVSQRDPGVGGGRASDPIARHGWSDYRKPIQLRPYDWTFGIAVELTNESTPVMRKVVGRDGVEKTVPAYGLVIERDWVFWESLRKARKRLGLKELTSIALQVRRSGPRQKHQFAFEVAHQAIDFEPPAEAVIDLDLVLDKLASLERVATYIAPLADDHCPWSSAWA